MIIIIFNKGWKGKQKYIIVRCYLKIDWDKLNIYIVNFRINILKYFSVNKLIEEIKWNFENYY